MAAPKKAHALSHFHWLLLLPIPALWCLLSHYGLLTFLENKSEDWRFQFRGELESPVKIVYVDVDSFSIDAIGSMPWDRAIFSRVSEALVNEGQVRAIGLDFVFSEAGMAQSADRRLIAAGNVEFGRFLNRQPPVVLAAAYGGWQFVDINGRVAERFIPLVAIDRRPLASIEPPEMPAFNLSADETRKQLYYPPFIGLIDTIDNGTRAVPAWTPSNVRRTFFHLSLELARLYWGLPPGAIVVEGDAVKFMRPDGSVQATVPLRDRQVLEVNWFNQWYSPHTMHVEFAAVLTHAEALSDPEASADERQAAHAFFAQEAFKDAVVLVGPVDPLLQDLAPTSLDRAPVPKVGVHGNLLNTIVSGAYLQRLDAWADHAILLVLTAIVATLSLAGGARALFAKIMAVLAVAIYVALVFQSFRAAHLVLPFTAPIGAALTTSFAGLIWQVVEEQKAKKRIKGMFGAYVSPDLVNNMIESGEDPQLGGHDSEITAYFSDIQGFSTFSEKLKSGPLVELMNEYLTACTDIVQAEGGTLDKYIGDAVVAMFGAPIAMPDHAYRACVATQRVHLKLAELREKWKAEGDKWPAIVPQMQSRIGLNTGVCMIGNMGSRTRFNYTMMGDDVNLAARMESGAKSWGAYTMCSETTKLACEKHGGDHVVFRPLGRIVVKGRTRAVPIYEIVGLKENVSDRTRECLALFTQGLEKYYACDWDAALTLFARSRDLEFNIPGETPGVSSNPSLVYLDITAAYKEEPPPANWDGVYHMKEK